MSGEAGRDVLSRSSTPALPRIGCDLQRIDHVDRAVADFGARYLDRVYTDAEQRDCRVGGAPSLAARFAAKEAVLKLLGTADGVDPREVEVTGGGGRPRVRLHGRAAWIARRTGTGPIDVSLSHDATTAFAVAVALTRHHDHDENDEHDDRHHQGEEHR
ncbi:holo-ACP synthase [Nocardioides rubriscoriae]|uniref:holo-ACP synthase n=1 Tax=Nocardioides rubriscoriae TaxID=642762 RepID=UPI0014789364|nr:holo-ACP synthase [Nocardioides rubriscoriae]